VSPAHFDVEPVRLAVVGLGYWGPNLVRNFHDLSCASIEYVCDQREEALAPTAQRYPTVRATLDFGDILADKTVEAVAIATPVGTHTELVAAALEAGKHVFVEKPLASSVADAERLVRRAEELGRVLMPGHTFLYSPPVNILRDYLHSGELGEIYFISSSRVNLGIHQSDVSVIWDLGAHDFSILCYWLDDMPVSVSAVSRSCVIPGIHDVAFIDLMYASGMLAHVELSWLAPSKLRRTAVVGSRKMAVYDDTSNEPVRIFDSGVMPRDPESFGEYRLTYRTGDIVSPQVAPVEPLALELRDFCMSIREGRQPCSSALLGLDVIRIIEAACRSLDFGGARIELSEVGASVG
jgi:predicted dehydrogenase